MAPGGSNDVSSIGEGHSHYDIFPPNIHASSPNVHPTPSSSLRDADLPLYTKHHHHYHPVQSEGVSTSAAEDTPKEKSSSAAMNVEKPHPTPAHGVDFAHGLEAEENALVIAPSHHAIQDLVRSVVDPPSRTLLSQPSGLRRGLQIPSRRGVITWGFKIPPLLASAGVTKIQWKLFTHEVKSQARLSGKQVATFVAVSVACGVLCSFVTTPFAAAVPCTFLGYQWQKKTEHENMEAAQNTGVLDMLMQRWNQNYFEPLGLHVAVALPQMGKMEDMDVSSTKLFRYQQKVGSSSATAGTASTHTFPKEFKYQRREGHQRVKAANKARIIVMPLEDFRNGVGQAQESGLVNTQGNPFSDPIRSGETIANTPAISPFRMEQLGYRYRRGRWRHGSYSS